MRSFSEMGEGGLMLVTYFREEEFGYIVIGDKAEVALVKPEAKAHLKRGELINPDHYKPTTLRATVPFRLRAPLIVMLEVTKRCNLNCGHCYIRAGEPRENEFDTEGMYRVLDELRENNVFHLFITGGEPFTRSDIVDIINYAEESGFFVQIVTNGTLLTEEIVSQIKNRGRIGFGMTYLGGLDNGLSFDEAFDILKSKAALLKKYKFPVMCWYCLTKLNYDFEPNVSTWCSENNVTIDYRDVQPLGRCREHTHLLLDLDEAQKEFEEMQRGELQPADTVPDQPDSSHRSVFDVCYILELTVGACKGGRSFANICANGDVYPCSNCAAEELHLAGNLRENSFSDIWQNSFKSMRAVTWDDFKGCKTCELAEYFGEGRFCKLRCPPLSQVIHGDPLYCGATEHAKTVSKFRTVWTG